MQRHSQGGHPAGSAACVVGSGPELPRPHIAMAGALPLWRAVQAEAERCRELRHRLVVCSATANGFVKHGENTVCVVCMIAAAQLCG
jgi:hypothetical protein